MDLGPALFLADKSGAIRWCNSGYRRVAEVQTEDGRIGDLLPLRQVAEEIEYSRATVYREDRYIIGQTTQILKSRMVPVFDNDGALNGFGGILQMFADHGIGTEDIALMLDRYMDFLRLTADWVWETDAQLNFTMVSQRVTNALDRPPQDYIGKNLLTMMVTDTLRQAAKRRFERMAPFRDVPFDAVDGEGKRRLFMLSAVPVFDRADGALKGYRGAATDITELTKREESLRMAKEQADVASRAKTHFLANMSHELRTPLNAIIGFADVMRMEMIGPVSNPQYKSYIRDIHGSALHLLGIINDILDVSRIEAGKVTLHESVVSLDEVVESVTRLVKERVTDSQLSLDLDVAPKLPRVHRRQAEAEADPDQPDRQRHQVHAQARPHHGRRAPVAAWRAGAVRHRQRHRHQPGQHRPGAGAVRAGRLGPAPQVRRRRPGASFVSRTGQAAWRRPAPRKRARQRHAGDRHAAGLAPARRQAPGGGALILRCASTSHWNGGAPASSVGLAASGARYPEQSLS